MSYGYMFFRAVRPRASVDELGEDIDFDLGPPEEVRSMLRRVYPEADTGPDGHGWLDPAHPIGSMRPTPGDSHSLTLSRIERHEARALCDESGLTAFGCRSTELILAAQPPGES